MILQLVRRIYLEEEVGSNKKFIKCSIYFLGDKQGKHIIFIHIQIYKNYKRKEYYVLDLSSLGKKSNFASLFYALCCAFVIVEYLSLYSH